MTVLVSIYLFNEARLVGQLPLQSDGGIAIHLGEPESRASTDPMRIPGSMCADGFVGREDLEQGEADEEYESLIVRDCPSPRQDHLSRQEIDKEDVPKEGFIAW